MAIYLKFKMIFDITSSDTKMIELRQFESDHPDKDRMRVCDNADPLRFYPCANNLQTHIFIQYSEILLLTTRIEIKNPRS